MADFDPDAFLAKVGDSAPAAPAFDPDAFLAKVAAPPEPSRWDRVKGSFSRMGETMASGASAVGTSLRHPIDTFTDPARRRELERGLSDMTTFGLAEKAARAVDPERFGDEQAAKDAANAPGFRAGGNLLGIAGPGAVSAAGGLVPGIAGRVLQGASSGLPEVLGGVAAKAIPGAGALAGTARGLAGYEATAPVAAAIQAPEGHRMDAALDAASDPAGLLLSGGAGAAAGVAPEARALLQRKGQERMFDQAIKDFAGSKETGMSKPTDRRQIARQIDAIKSELRDPEAIKISDTARKDPGAAWEMVQKRVDDITTDRQASYAAVDQATGGVRVKEFRRFLEDKAADLGREPGQQLERQAVEGMIGDIDNTWGNQLSPSVPTIKFRQYVTRLQRTAADTMGSIEETRRMQILEQTSGLAKDFLDRNLDVATKLDPEMRPVVDGLKDQNRRVSAWLSLEDALKTRTSKLETQNMVDRKPMIATGGAAAAAAAAQFLHSPMAAAGAAAIGAAPYVVPPVDRALTRAAASMQPAATASPAAVARLIQAARAGASRAALQQQAQQDGVPTEIADNLAQQSGR